MELSKLLIALVALLMSVSAGGQTLNIVSNGQTGSSGTNWSVSGTNPVTITATGNANVNTSVVEAYLNSGVSVMVQCIISNGAVVVASPISKTSGADATLTFRADKRVTTSFAITSGTTREIINEKLVFFLQFNIIYYIWPNFFKKKVWNLKDCG
jgi:hypothetical protein